MYMATISKKADVIYQFLLQIINSQKTSIGDLLPTEDDLKNRFNISRPTISKALDQLEHEGYIHRKQGVGTFVAQKKQQPQEKKSIGLLFPLFGKGEIFEVITRWIQE